MFRKVILASLIIFFVFVTCKKKLNRLAMAMVEEENTPATDDTTLSILGSYLTSEYGILRRVFSFLSVCDLIQCKGVCRDWKEAAVLTVKNRRKIHCIMVHQRQLENIVSDAHVTISFCTVDLSDPSSFLSEETYSYISRHGIFSITTDSKAVLLRTRNNLPLKPKHFSQTAVRFPRAHGFVIKTVKFELDELITEEEALATINKETNFNIKAVIIMNYDEMADSPARTSITNILNAIIKIPLNCAIGGCALMIDKETQPKEITLFLIGGPNVEAASCVLDHNVRTQEVINHRMEQFSKDVEKVNNGVIMAFRCCDRRKVRRDYNHKRRDNIETWETNAIITYFPETPVVGCYGNGEFGANYPIVDVCKRSKNESSPLEYGFSTILVYIGVKK